MSKSELNNRHIILHYFYLWLILYSIRFFFFIFCEIDHYEQHGNLGEKNDECIGKFLFVPSNVFRQI